MSDFSTFYQFFNQFHQVSEEVMLEYFSLWTEEHYLKRSVITQAGDIQRDTYFVLAGMQKSYYLQDGKQHIIAFTYAPSLSGIPESFFMQAPSRYFLESISNTRLLKVSYEKHHAMMMEHRGLETLMRKMTELVLAGVIERHHELMAHDIETRFRNFVKRSPHLLNMVSQKDLASYLRIDPTNLSKLLNSVKL